MDDYSLASLNESKNEWCSRLLNVLTPHFIRGIQSIYDESVSICKTNREPNKYLMTFQNFLSRIPHWNNHIIENERERILEASECPYLEDIITCIHILQLKMLSCIRVSHENKKVDLKPPSLDTFLHTVYINIAKKLYTNVYLFENTAEPMAKQRNNREVELIVRECIINTVRDNIPVAELLRIFMDEGEEHDTETETREVTVAEDADKRADADGHGLDEAGASGGGAEGPEAAAGLDDGTIVVKKSDAASFASETGSEAESESGKKRYQLDDLDVDLDSGDLDGGHASSDAPAPARGKTTSYASKQLLPLKVESLDFPREPSPKKEGGISFADTVVEYAEDGAKSVSSIDGYESDKEPGRGHSNDDDEEPVKLKIVEPSQSDDLDLGLDIIPV